MAHWLFKSEPSVWSFDQMKKAGAKGTSWNGIRNHSAKLNMMAMKLGEEGFFYHSNEGKAIVGIVTVIKLYYPDPTDETAKFGMVDLAAVRELPKPVTLGGQGGAAPRQNGAGRQFQALRSAGDGGGMGVGVQDGRRLTPQDVMVSRS